MEEVRVALLFTDGVGIGRRDPEINPLARAPYLMSHFEDGTGTPLPPGGRFTSVDACFGLEGRPQSASNQTALLTGEPAPALTGRHVLGYPDAPLRELLAQRSIVKRLVEAGRTAEFINCYPAGYLDALGLARRPSQAEDVTISARHRRRLKPSASTCAFAAGNVPLRTLDDARAGEGLTHDIEGERAFKRGFQVPRRTPEEAAGVFWALASRTDFTFFEHYLADEAGHAQDADAATRALASFDAFARAVVALRPPEAAVVLCSDHGNVEDLSLRNHTLARVPVVSFGRDEHFRELQTLADVGRAVLRTLRVTR